MKLSDRSEFYRQLVGHKFVPVNLVRDCYVTLRCPSHGETDHYISRHSEPSVSHEAECVVSVETACALCVARSTAAASLGAAGGRANKGKPLSDAQRAALKRATEAAAERNRLPGWVVEVVMTRSIEPYLANGGLPPRGFSLHALRYHRPTGLSDLEIAHVLGKSVSRVRAIRREHGKEKSDG